MDKLLSFIYQYWSPSPKHDYQHITPIETVQYYHINALHNLVLEYLHNLKSKQLERSFYYHQQHSKRSHELNDDEHDQSKNNDIFSNTHHDFHHDYSYYYSYLPSTSNPTNTALFTEKPQNIEQTPIFELPQQLSSHIIPPSPNTSTPVQHLFPSQSHTPASITSNVDQSQSSQIYSNTISVKPSPTITLLPIPPIIQQFPTLTASNAPLSYLDFLTILQSTPCRAILTQYIADTTLIVHLLCFPILQHYPYLITLHDALTSFSMPTLLQQVIQFYQTHYKYELLYDLLNVGGDNTLPQVNSQDHKNKNDKILSSTPGPSPLTPRPLPSIGPFINPKNINNETFFTPNTPSVESSESTPSINSIDASHSRITWLKDTIPLTAKQMNITPQSVDTLLYTIWRFVYFLTLTIIITVHPNINSTDNISLSPIISPSSNNNNINYNDENPLQFFQQNTITLLNYKIIFQHVETYIFDKLHHVIKMLYSTAYQFKHICHTPQLPIYTAHPHSHSQQKEIITTDDPHESKCSENSVIYKCPCGCESLNKSLPSTHYHSTPGFHSSPSSPSSPSSSLCATTEIPTYYNPDDDDHDCDCRLKGLSSSIINPKYPPLLHDACLKYFSFISPSILSVMSKPAHFLPIHAGMVDEDGQNLSTSSEDDVPPTHPYYCSVSKRMISAEFLIAQTIMSIPTYLLVSLQHQLHQITTPLTTLTTPSSDPTIQTLPPTHPQSPQSPQKPLFCPLIPTSVLDQPDTHPSLICRRITALSWTYRYPTLLGLPQSVSFDDLASITPQAYFMALSSPAHYHTITQSYYLLSAAVELTRMRVVHVKELKITCLLRCARYLLLLQQFVTRITGKDHAGADTYLPLFISAMFITHEPYLQHLLLSLLHSSSASTTANTPSADVSLQNVQPSRGNKFTSVCAPILLFIDIDVIVAQIHAHGSSRDKAIDLPIPQPVSASLAYKCFCCTQNMCIVYDLMYIRYVTLHLEGGTQSPFLLHQHSTYPQPHFHPQHPSHQQQHFLPSHYIITPPDQILNLLLPSLAFPTAISSTYEKLTTLPVQYRTQQLTRDQSSSDVMKTIAPKKTLQSSTVPRPLPFHAIPVKSSKIQDLYEFPTITAAKSIQTLSQYRQFYNYDKYNENNAEIYTYITTMYPNYENDSNSTTAKLHEDYKDATFHTLLTTFYHILNINFIPQYGGNLSHTIDYTHNNNDSSTISHNNEDSLHEDDLNPSGTSSIYHQNSSGELIYYITTFETALSYISSTTITDLIFSTNNTQNETNLKSTPHNGIDNQENRQPYIYLSEALKLCHEYDKMWWNVQNNFYSSFTTFYSTPPNTNSINSGLTSTALSSNVGTSNNKQSTQTNSGTSTSFTSTLVNILRQYPYLLPPIVTVHDDNGNSIAMSNNNNTIGTIANKTPSVPYTPLFPANDKQSIPSLSLGTYEAILEKINLQNTLHSKQRTKLLKLVVQQLLLMHSLYTQRVLSTYNQQNSAFIHNNITTNDHRPITLTFTPFSSNPIAYPLHSKSTLLFPRRYKRALKYSTQYEALLSSPQVENENNEKSPTLVTDITTTDSINTCLTSPSFPHNINKNKEDTDDNKDIKLPSSPTWYSSMISAISYLAPLTAVRSGDNHNPGHNEQTSLSTSNIPESIPTITTNIPLTENDLTSPSHGTNSRSSYDPLSSPINKDNILDLVSNIIIFRLQDTVDPKLIHKRYQQVVKTIQNNENDAIETRDNIGGTAAISQVDPIYQQLLYQYQQHDLCMVEIFKLLEIVKQQEIYKQHHPMDSDK